MDSRFGLEGYMSLFSATKANLNYHKSVGNLVIDDLVAHFLFYRPCNDFEFTWYA